MVASPNRKARRASRKRLGIVRKNVCGDCDVCCEVIAVGEIDKPLGQRCEHQNGRGCAIYAKRPRECAEYRCEWLMGGWAPSLRPDRLGVVLNGQKKPIEGCEIVAFETRPGGLATAAPVLADVARKAGPVLLVGPTGPDGLPTLSKLEADVG